MQDDYEENIENPLHKILIKCIYWFFSLFVSYTKFQKNSVESYTYPESGVYSYGN